MHPHAEGGLRRDVGVRWHSHVEDGLFSCPIRWVSGVCMSAWPLGPGGTCHDLSAF